MKWLLNKIKNNKYIFLSFIISIITMCILYALQKIAPFGENSMLDVDFYHQYGPLLNELTDRVIDGKSLLYSYNTGLGIPFYRNFLNYLSSPFNIFLFLFRKENIVMAFSIVIALKVVFATCTMTFYLKKTFNNNSILACVFGLLYALSGYFCAYYWNIMWLDGMVFLPLVAFGINRLVDDKKAFYYIISLALMLFANYFIGYMICIFSVMYFVAYLLYRSNFDVKSIYKNNKKTIFMYIISSILSAGLVAFALIPLYYSLASISATHGVFPSNSFQFSIHNYVFNHLSGVNRTVFASDELPLPNVYPGLLTLASLIMLFINKKINYKFKFIVLTSIIIFFLLFNVNSLDYIMHAFHVPNDLPWRYSFLYVFILVTAGYYSFCNIKYLSVIKISVSFGIIIILTLLASKLSFANFDDKRAIMTLILLLIYYCLILLTKYYNKMSNKIYIVMLLVVMFEVIYSININWNIDHNIKQFMSDKKYYRYLINYINKKDNDLYRIEKTDYLTLNDGAWYNYNGVSTFTSMAYENVAKSQRKLGISGNDINSYYYHHYQTPIYNTMFNIKYLMGNYIQNDYYKVIKQADSHNLIYYNKPSSIAYATDNNIKKWNTISYKPFLNQSNFVTLSTGINDIYDKVQVKEVIGGKILNNSFIKNSNGEFNYSLDTNDNKIKFILNNLHTQNIYLYIGGDNVKSFEVDDEYYSLTSDEYYILDIGKKSVGDVTVNVNLENSNDGYIYFYAYSINEDNFNKFYKQIEKEKLKINKYNDILIEGNLVALTDKMVFTSIAYDEGWNVYVDNNKVRTYKIDNAYLGFDIKKGKHKIELKYYPKGMALGLIISCISFIFTIVIILLENNVIIKNAKKDEFNV